MMDTETLVRTVVWLPRDLYRALKRAAVEAGELMPDAIRQRLLSSLPDSQAAERSGCAGDGEARRVSPELV